MENSNIVGGSNVYPCKENNLFDKEFVEQISDLNKLKSIIKKRETDSRVVELNKNQLSIVHNGMRCTFSKHDPCIGFVKDKGIVNKCINIECPGLYDRSSFYGKAPWKGCNPSLTKEYVRLWTREPEANEEYGNPKKQKKYYLVDLVSEQEKLRYYTEAEDDDILYPILEDEELKSIQEKPTERKKVIIGYERTYFGVNDPDEQLSPIWGYVDDDDTVSLVANKYGSTKTLVNSNVLGKKDKKEDKQKEKKAIKEDRISKTDNKTEIDKDTKEKYENTLRTKVSGKYSITEINTEMLYDIFGNNNVILVTANESELAYVSGTLMQLGIEHNIERKSYGQLLVICNGKTIDLLNADNIMLTSSFITRGCDNDTIKMWEKLQKVKSAFELTISGRDFFDFETLNGKRWGCRNLYGATHIVINIEDLCIDEDVIEEQKITLLLDKKNYIILSTNGAEKLGLTNDSLWDALDKLMNANEITEFPRIITGFYISKTCKDTVIKGIGHMKFDEY